MGTSRAGMVVVGWALVVAFGPAFSCPQQMTPPPTLPLPDTADPPKRQEIRFNATSGGGYADGRGFGGAALRGTFAPLPGFMMGVELGGGGGSKSDTTDPAGGSEVFTVVTTRILVSYGFWAYRNLVALSGEIGLTTGLYNAIGVFVGPDATLSFTAGGPEWWALTLSYRVSFIWPSSEQTWRRGLYQMAALTLIVPRRSRYGFLIQAGFYYGYAVDRIDPGDDTGALGIVAVAGFRFNYGYPKWPTSR